LSELDRLGAGATVIPKSFGAASPTSFSSQDPQGMKTALPCAQ
jgi:hypothetical protein